RFEPLVVSNKGALFGLLNICEKLCCVGKKLYHCPCCSRGNFKPTGHKKAVQHLEGQFRKSVEVDGSLVIRCSINGPGHPNSKTHWHCPRCLIAIHRRGHFRDHIRINKCKKKKTKRIQYETSNDDSSTTEASDDERPLPTTKSNKTKTIN
ncbi:unnamed protein product, partial [Owenia fusiformis]